jgi:hypothetical protein
MVKLSRCRQTLEKIQRYFADTTPARHKPIKDPVGDGGIADLVVPLANRQLTVSTMERVW